MLSVRELHDIIGSNIVLIAVDKRVAVAAGLNDKQVEALRKGKPPDTSQVIGECVVCSGGKIHSLFTHNLNISRLDTDQLAYVPVLLRSYCVGCGLTYEAEFVKK